MTQIPLPNPPIADKNGLTLYAIIDCAHFDHKFYRKIRKDLRLTTKSLFADTKDEPSAFASPVLLQINSDDSAYAVDKLQAIEQEKPAIVWLWSAKDFKSLFDILQPMLYGEGNNGKKVFCRYYDPRCTAALLEMFKADNETAQNLQNIKAWAYWKNGQYQYLTQ